MNYQDDPKVKQRLEDLEAEFNPTSFLGSKSDFSQKLKTFYNQFLTWFQQLPKVGQIIVGVVGLAAGLTLLRTVVELISLAITLAVVGVIGYIGYQFFKSSKFSK